MSLQVPCSKAMRAHHTYFQQQVGSISDICWGFADEKISRNLLSGLELFSHMPVAKRAGQMLGLNTFQKLSFKNLGEDCSASIMKVIRGP